MKPLIQSSRKKEKNYVDITLKQETNEIFRRRLCWLRSLFVKSPINIFITPHQPIYPAGIVSSLPLTRAVSSVIKELILIVQLACTKTSVINLYLWSIKPNQLNPHQKNKSHDSYTSLESSFHAIRTLIQAKCFLKSHQTNLD